MTKLRYLVLTDVHSNFPALKAVLSAADKDGPYDGYLFAGDGVGYGSDPHECTQELRDRNFIWVRGNHDGAVATGNSPGFNSIAKFSVEHNRKLLLGKYPDDIEFLKSLRPDPYLGSENRFEMVHGSPHRTFETDYDEVYIEEESDAISAMKAMQKRNGQELVEIPVCIFGHWHYPKWAKVWFEGDDRWSHGEGFEYYEHQPWGPYEGGHLDLETRKVTIDINTPSNLGLNRTMVLRPDESRRKPVKWSPKILFNPGSVGQPRHGSYAACWGIIEIDDGKGEVTLEFRNTEYDVAETQNRMRAAGLPDLLIDRLALGR